MLKNGVLVPEIKIESWLLKNWARVSVSLNINVSTCRVSVKTVLMRNKKESINIKYLITVSYTASNQYVRAVIILT